MEVSRRSLIKGIGAAICAGVTPAFVRAALPSEVLTTQQSVKAAQQYFQNQNANRHRFWDNVDANHNPLPGHEGMSTAFFSKGYRKNIRQVVKPEDLTWLDTHRNIPLIIRTD